jgi:polysaccharide pyruvyl transferase CsaB
VKLLQLGYAGHGNAGDEALLAAELAALRAVGRELDIRVVSGDPATTRRVHGVDAVARTDAVALHKAVRWCDGLIVGGGSLLQDVTSVRPVAFYAGLALAAGRLGKVVSWYAAGLGPLRRRGNRILAARALARADYLSVRDPVSLALADDLGVIGAELVGDPVLAGVPGLAGIRRVRTGRPRVAVALRPWADDGWLDEVLSALTLLADEMDLVLVPMQAGVDVELAEAVARSIEASRGSAVEVTPNDGGYVATLAALRSADVVIGMRLHALVAAAASQRPFVALSYDPKVDAFARQLGVAVTAHIPGRLDGEALVRDVRSAASMSDIALKEYAANVTDLARGCAVPARRTVALVARAARAE